MRKNRTRISHRCHNHAIRGQRGKNDRARCRRYLKKYGIPYSS